MRDAAIHCLTGAVKLNGMNPRAYLPIVVERIADYPIN
jgi:hypothetical protein